MNNLTASILVTGDLVPIDKAEQMLISGEYEKAFGNFLPEIRTSDLAVTNFETAATCGGEAIKKWGPNLRVNPEVLPALVKAGFDLFALANNHSRDWGNEAFIETMTHIENAGGKYVGGGKDLAGALEPYRCELNGIKVTVFNATMHQPCCALADCPGANPLVPARLAAQIAAEKGRADFILVSIHDGKEQNPFVSRRIRENYRGFIDAGAHAVINHHPHIAQGYENYKNGFIAYSLGNFYFPSRNPAEAPGFWYRGFAVKLDIAPGKVVKAQIIPHKLDPETQCLALMAGEELAAFEERIDKQNKILANDDLCDLYFGALSARSAYPYYHKMISTDVDYLAHATETEEHVDSISAAAMFITDGKEYPADLDYFASRD